MISTFGASHWNPAIVRQMWALAVTGLGRHEDALSWHADGIAILRGALADSPSQISYSLVALAESALSAGELGVAEKALREASELTVTHNPSNGSLLATIALHEAHLHEELGRFAEAEALFSRVRGELLQFIGDGVSLAAAQAGLGRAAWRRGDPSAEATLRAALARADVLYGGAGPASARTRLDLARVMGPSRRVEAEGLLYAAIDALEAESAEPDLRVELLWEAARLETDPEIAERLLDEAREIAATRATPRSLGFIAEGLMR
jgi:tetratricopeptide (TPR) repeat protein